jgi:hypothetical protein
MDRFLDFKFCLDRGEPFVAVSRGRDILRYATQIAAIAIPHPPDLG